MFSSSLKTKKLSKSLINMTVDFIVQTVIPLKVKVDTANNYAGSPTQSGDCCIQLILDKL